MQENNDKIKKLGEHIKKLRKSKKHTLSSLSYRNGLEPSTISRIEKGLVEPKYLTLLRIAEALEISVSELVNLKED